jgi:TolB protein
LNIFKLTILFSIIFLLALKAMAQGEGYKEEQLTHNAFDNRYASYNKAGEAIIFESNRDGHWQIYSMDIDGKNQRRVINSTSNDRRPTWHPFNNMILFESDRNGISDLFTFDLDTKELKKVPIPLNGNKSYAHFAPNGKELIFNYKVSDNNYNIYIISANGKRLKTIVNNAYENMYPRYSPRGDAILYFSRKNSKREFDEIYVYNLYAKKEARLTRWPLHNFYASFSNSGSRIAYVNSKEDREPEIYIMNKDGKSPRQITFNSTVDILPNWSPHDFNLLITGYRNGNYQICKILLKEEL